MKSKSSWWLNGKYFVCSFLAAGFNLCAQSNPDTSTPIGFFTNTADRFLRARPEFFTQGISITNIPIYPTNFYTPSLHRLLQLAANVYDATTNKALGPDGFDYPSVFRPTFNRSGTNIFISGYVEEQPDNRSWSSIPLSLPQDAASVGPDTTNIYSIPWIIGARKGFPNFNEVALQSISQITRKLELIRPFVGSLRTSWHTNIQYTVGISNAIGVEAWNSYATNIARPVHLVVADTLVMVLTNETGLVLSSNSITAGTNWVYSAADWPGSINFGNQLLTAPSFQVPLYTNFVFLPDSVYRQQSSSLVINTNTNEVPPFETTVGFPLPHFVLSVTNRLRFIMLDAVTDRVIDYMQLDGMDTIRDLTAELSFIGGNPFENTPVIQDVWNPTRLAGDNSPYQGLLYQIDVSSGAYPVGMSDWNNSQLQPTSLQTKQAQISQFNAFYNNAPAVTNLSMQAPFVPTRKISESFSWQANDPLVHYTLGDLASFPQTNQLDYWVPAFLSTNLVLPNIGKLNNRYSPWGGYPATQGQGDTNAFNLALKDPLVTRSDDWQFPAGSVFSPGWVGSIHRGTPWQTIYLKSSAVDSSSWQAWTGNALTNDALITQPTNDWHLASLIVSLLNTNDPRQLFSVNQTNLAPALEGIMALTNTDSGLASLSMDSNSPQAAFIVSGINALRTSQPGQLFYDIGDLLAAPELSISSPWLNPVGSISNEISDLAYEIIPSQLLFLVRPDSIGSIISTAGLAQIQFTGLDGYRYVVQVSENLRDWTSLATQVTTNGLFIFTDSSATTNSSRRYFRSLLAP